MQLKSIQTWLTRKWRPADAGLVYDYQVTFSTAQGQRVLQHLLDSVYCTVDESNDPIRCVVHNARRSVVQDILMNLDMAENPSKYQPPVADKSEKSALEKFLESEGALDGMAWKSP